MLLETALLLILASVLIYQYICKQWNILNVWNIPHEPPSLRNAGHAVLMYGKNTVEYELQCKRKFGNVWGWYLMTQPHIVIHDPEMIRHIMIKGFSSFPNRFGSPDDFGTKDLEKGLLAAQWEHWKRMRSSLSPTFSNMKLKAMSRIAMNCIKNTELRLAKMTKNKSSGTVDIKDLFNRLSLDVVCSVVFSIDVNSQDDALPEPEISKKAKMFFLLSLVERIRVFIKLSFPSLRRFIGEGARREPVSYLKNLIQKLINDRKNRPVDQNNLSGRHDIMEAMLKARKTIEELRNQDQNGLTDSEIMGNAITMLLAGYDTTAVAMTYLAYNLAFRDDAQAKLRQEIDEAFEDEEVDFETATKLKYLDMCMNESMRLYCPVGRTIRTASRDVTISGVNIPKGVVVDIPVASLCRDPDHWDDPMMYNPERMREMQAIDPMIYQPFGSGPRNCIGMKFAFMEIKLAFCAILRKYSFKPVAETPKPPLVLKQLTTTTPIEDIKLKLIPRKHL